MSSGGSAGTVEPMLEPTDGLAGVGDVEASGRTPWIEIIDDGEEAAPVADLRDLNR